MQENLHELTLIIYIIIKVSRNFCKNRIKIITNIQVVPQGLNTPFALLNAIRKKFRPQKNIK
ncbi:hypothetical protein PMI37_03830 [Pseudomonas sp. GM80]|nr:hypothetical protein PMI37_03830 [Pseudomonas sp. GM80]